MIYHTEHHHKSSSPARIPHHQSFNDTMAKAEQDPSFSYSGDGVLIFRGTGWVHTQGRAGEVVIYSWLLVLSVRRGRSVKAGIVAFYLL
jgi:hypothetical protein